MYRNVIYFTVMVLCLSFLLSGCLKDTHRVHQDITQQREGYYSDGSYHNDFYGFSWKIPNWNPITPRVTLGQRFIFGWDSPTSDIKARLWMYDRSLSDQGRDIIQASASLREAAATIALRQGWGFLDSQKKEFNGRISIKSTYIQGDDEKGIAYVWMENDAVFAVNAYAESRYYDQHESEMESVLKLVSFVHSRKDVDIPYLDPEDMPTYDPDIGNFLSHTISYKGETLALISQWYTGTTTNWPRILQANPDISPTALRLGQEILIPSDLVIKEDPLPQSFIRPASRPATQKQDRAEEIKEEKVEDEPDEPDLPDFIMAPAQ